MSPIVEISPQSCIISQVSPERKMELSKEARSGFLISLAAVAFLFIGAAAAKEANNLALENGAKQQMNIQVSEEERGKVVGLELLSLWSVGGAVLLSKIASSRQLLEED